MKNKSFITTLVLGALLLFQPILQSEILEIEVSWNSTKCNKSCADLLQKKFENMRQIESVSVNPSSGVAKIKWNTKSPFTYQAIKTQMQMVGVAINAMRVRIRGNAMAQGNRVILTSIGDNTRFTLLSPIKVERNKYTTLPNASLLKLSDELTEKILSEAKLGKVIVIEGPIYQGSRSPPLNLIVNRLQIEKKK